MPDCNCEQMQAEGEYPDCEIHVHCDEWCMALDDPQTDPEIRAALTHWRRHRYLSGCSHAN